MAAYTIDIDSPAGPALNGVHDGSSAEHSPSSSRISSESPTVTPSLTFQFGTSLAVGKDGGDRRAINDSPSTRLFSEDVDTKAENNDESPGTEDVHMDDYDDGDHEELDIKPDIASLDFASPMAQSPIIAGRRPRGRPRKHPKPEQASLAKKPMGRSKTGCITCRRRKKKCDERKPTCVHCEKNNVQCEGYHPKDIWQSGRQKALARGRSQRRWSQDGPASLPSIMPGVDDELDWQLFEHFYHVLSNLLSIHPEVNNPFRHHLLPMAQNHRGLMHSLLSLSGAHLLVKTDTSLKDGRIEERSVMHFDKALTHLRNDQSMKKRIEGDLDARMPAPTVAQVVILCLQTICEGNTTGTYSTHLSALKTMLEGTIDTTEEEYLRFLSEFLIYHDMSAALTSKRPTWITSDDFKLPTFIPAGAKNFLGVCDGLVGPTSKTRLLRDRVRKRREEQQRPYVDFNTIMDGKAIDADLKTATCEYEVGTDEWVAWNLYKTTFWLYLHRTLNNSTASPELENGVSKAIEYLQSIDPNSSLQCILLTPTFIIACATFNQQQRPAINDAFDVLERFSSLGNIKHARQVVDRVWKFMDAGNDCSWDWEGIMEEMNMNFLIT